MTQADKMLVESLHRGDPYACDEMVAQYSGKIYSLALRLTGHPNEAEDILQETFIKACQAVGSFEGRASLGTWLHTIATNNSLMRLRKKRTPTIPIDQTDQQTEEAGDEPFLQLSDWYWEPESLVLSDELQTRMDQAVDELPDNLRLVFVMRDLEGFSTKAAAEALGITESNLKVRLYRARLLLRKALAAYLSEHPPYQLKTGGVYA